MCFVRPWSSLTSNFASPRVYGNLASQTAIDCDKCLASTPSLLFAKEVLSMSMPRHLVLLLLSILPAAFAGQSRRPLVLSVSGGGYTSMTGGMALARALRHLNGKDELSSVTHIGGNSGGSFFGNQFMHITRPKQMEASKQKKKFSERLAEVSRITINYNPFPPIQMLPSPI